MCCITDSKSDPELKHGYILNVSRKTPSPDLVKNQDSDLPKVDVERNEIEKSKAQALNLKIL